MKKSKKTGFLKLIVLGFISFIIFENCSIKPADIGTLCDKYITNWKEFYPSAAFAAGDKDSAFRFEELSEERIEAWLTFNRDILSEIENQNNDLSFNNRVDAAILKKKIKSEITKWQVDKIHENSPSLYSGMISQALTYVLVRGNLSPREKMTAITNRLTGIRKLCSFAIKTVKSGRPAQTKRSIKGLESTARFFVESLPGILKRETKQKFFGGSRPPAGAPSKEAIEESSRYSQTNSHEGGFDASPRSGVLQKSPPGGRRRQEKSNLKTEENPQEFEKECVDTADSIKSLASHLEEKVLPSIKKSDTLGKEVYAKKIKLYTGLDLTPEKLEKISLEEIHRVRELMSKVAQEYWQEAYPNAEIPANLKELLGKALQDMEENREDNQQDFLKLFIDLTDRAEAFVREKKIAPLPDKRTLFTDLSPAHFAGDAVGGVYSAGPFDPDADTLFYLPTVPDTAPEKVKEGFYRSFNNHFNTMIITHEMFPGHYLHLKISAKNARRIRSLFGGSLYAEGWATLCEQLTLNAGWDENNKLTRLAHLRKILENATRAYVSVQVHCNGWDKEKLTDFAVNTGLLAPQFAINLWHRVIGSPFQLTSYFLGFKAFTDVYEKEKEKAGAAFNLYDFSKKILYAGSLPVAMLPELFSDKK